ncbi:hypothetical protein LXL04_024613 [Taraxacum kok-saghyz]
MSCLIRVYSCLSVFDTFKHETRISLFVSTLINTKHEFVKHEHGKPVSCSCRVIRVVFQIARSTQNPSISNMGSKNITMIRDLALDRDEYMIKVKIIRLWKLTKFSNPNHVYEINMILMDEEGSKIQCNVEAAFIPRLGKLLEEYATNVNTSEYPAELTELIDRKLAFKLVIGKFNTVKNVRYYNVEKLTSDTRIISQLETIEKKLSSEQKNENEMYNDTLTDPSSQETVNLKDDTSETGDNSSPLSKNINNNYIHTSVPKMHTNNPNLVLNELKRKRVDVYDVDAPESESATKTYVKSKSGSNAGIPIKLLIPKIEK